MKKIYIAGSLFKEGDIKERKFEEDYFLKNGLNVFNPITAPFNRDKSNNPPISKDIFWGDTNEVLSSNYIFAEYDGEDPGVMAELGIAWAINHVHDLFEQGITPEDFIKKYPKKKLVVHATDIRIAGAHNYKNESIPYGLNQYVVGLIKDQGNVYLKKDEAFKAIINDKDK